MKTTALSEHRRAVFWPHLVFGAFVVLWLDDGVAAGLMTALPSIVKVGLVTFWLFLGALRSGSFLLKVATNAWPLAMMLLVTVLFASEILLGSQYSQGLSYLLVAFALCCFYFQEQFERERNVLMAVMVADLVITGVRTLIALQTDPLLARYLATTEDKRSAVYGSRDFSGLGGYPYAYSLAAILLLLLYFLVRSARKVAVLVALVAGGLVLVQMGFVTSIVLVLALGAFFLTRDLVRSPALQFILCAAVIFAWASGLCSVALQWIAGVPTLSEAVSTRLLELAGLLSGDSSAGSDLGARGSRWSDSVETFLSSGLFGLAGRGGTGQANGAHSQWLDLIASYGLLAALMPLFLVLAWRLTRTQISPVARHPLGRTWVYFVILGFVNPLLYSTIVLTWMFLLPALAEWLSDPARLRVPAASVAVSA